MKKTGLSLLLAMCLLLGGCSWLDGSYISVKAHQTQHQSGETQTLTASNYRELMQVLADLIADGTETGLVNIAEYPAESVDTGMAIAIRYATERYPLGAYAVSEIDYEVGTNKGLPALAVSISYRHSAAQIRAVQTVGDMEEACQAVATALKQYDSEVVLKVGSYATTDFAQVVRNYAEEHPDQVMEIPQVTDCVYGVGKEKVVELTFTYQNSREDLRKMQTQVQPVFDSAVLYVSGDGVDNQKFSQLYAFLMERFPYQIETSITPAYSLLRHGVGDSRAFALIYAAMCREAGLTCLTVTGTCSGEPRTWNIVCDDGNYYHIDLLRCYQSGGFREFTDGEMTGYVWDYSAYPECPDPVEPDQQPQETSEKAEPPEKETRPQPEETQPETVATEPEDTHPEPEETTDPTEKENFEDF